MSLTRRTQAASVTRQAKRGLSVTAMGIKSSKAIAAGEASGRCTGSE